MTSHSLHPPVAIVGIAAQLPSGNSRNTNLDYDAFIDFLLNKGEAYELIPRTRFNSQNIVGRATGQILTESGTFLKDTEIFDHMEFGITAKDARAMPLGVRKLVETTFLSLCDSGIDYRGKNVGCYMSGVAHDIFSISGHDDSEASGSFAFGPSTVANRISYHLDLRGPTVPIDTACSSSLYATHLAVQALHAGECDSAVVGGSQMNHRFMEWLSYTQGGVLSPDGKCKPFDISANGFGRGEGVVVITLKLLESALRDHDYVYATILGTGVNSSGALVPANAPSAAAQKGAMYRAFRMSNRSPQEVDFIELHATGTSKGDPTEINWVGAEFKRDDELLVGSVKGNIGHLEITSFLASLCKVCGVLERGIIPPNVNLKTPNPAIHWRKYRLRVPLEAEPLRARAPTGRPLIAMSSSGITGANGHAVIEGAPPAAPVLRFWSHESLDKIPVLLVAGGLSPRSAEAVGGGLIEAVEKLAEEDVPALARAFGRRARSMVWRAFALASPESPSGGLSFGKPARVPKTRAPIVFVFSGQGTQHFQMGRELFTSCIPFRESILQLDAVYKSIVGTSLIDSSGLFTDAPKDSRDLLGDPWPITVTLPALTMIQLALVDALAAVGVTPDVVVGHSAGETAVLAASGSGTKEMALEVAIARGRAFALVEDAKGTMAAVSCSPKDARGIIEEVLKELRDGVLTVGCYNSPNAITLSGAETHIDAAVTKASARGIFARKLRTRVPVHSQIMEGCAEEFQTLVSDVFTRHSVVTPSIETYSATTGEAFNRLFDYRYFWDGTIGPVRFNDAITALLARHRVATFVEIGPHPALASYLTEHGSTVTVTCPLRRPRKPEPGIEVHEFVSALGKIVVAGHNCVDFDVLWGALPAEKRSRTKTPPYPFAPKLVPWAVRSPEITRQRQKRNGPMNYRQLAMNVKTHPGLADHIIKGEPIMPAAGFIEMALEFGANEVFDVKFHAMLPLSSEKPLPIQVELDGTHWSVSSAPTIDYSEIWPIHYSRLHATGYLSMEPVQDQGYERLDLHKIRSMFYDELSSFANYGPMYRRIRRYWLSVRPGGAMDSLGEIRGKGTDIPNISDYRMHPAILDAAIHLVAHPYLTGNFDPDLYHLPAKCRAFRLCPGYFDKPFPETVYSYAKFVDWTPGRITYDFTITDDTGVPLCRMEGLEVALHGVRMGPVTKRFNAVYVPTGVSLSKCKTVVNGIFNGNSTAHPHSDAHNSNESQMSTAPQLGALVIPYVRGEEMDIQQRISVLDALYSHSLLFTVDFGINWDAAQGFTRALRKEYLAWKVRLVAFHETWSNKQRDAAILSLIQMDFDEVDVGVDTDGNVLAPRLSLMDPPAKITFVDANKPWAVEDGHIVQTVRPQQHEDHVVVRVAGVGPRHGNTWVYLGAIEDSSGSVVGISSGPTSSHLLVHKKSFAEVDAPTFVDNMGPPLFAAILVALTVGLYSFSAPGSISGTRAIVVEEDPTLLSQIEEVCAVLGLHVMAARSLSSADLESCYDKKPPFIISGTQDPSTSAVLRRIIAPGGKLLLWNDPGDGLASIMATRPWRVGDALRCVTNARQYEPIVDYLSPASIFKDLPHNSSKEPPLFDAEKSYLLVGGIGRLGLHVALWMYENGARHLVITSRSGLEGLGRRGDHVAERILKYLLGRADLNLQAATADGASQQEMENVVAALPRPLGGCALLAVRLRDGMFATLTKGAFEDVFTPKVQAFEVLENVIDMKSLDFFVSFSSVCGLFGNPGQTNYATANMMLTGMTKKYKNAFTIVSPAISDLGDMILFDPSVKKNLRHLSNWAITARSLCDYIGDGIMKLRGGDTGGWQYVPDFDWAAVQENMGPSTLYSHLVPSNATLTNTETSEDPHVSLLQTVCRVLALKSEDVSVEVPLTSYGLDSLSAAALSFALRPLLAVSQVQLLADLAIKDLQERMGHVIVS